MGATQSLCLLDETTQKILLHGQEIEGDARQQAGRAIFLRHTAVKSAAFAFGPSAFALLVCLSFLLCGFVGYTWFSAPAARDDCSTEIKPPHRH